MSECSTAGFRSQRASDNRLPSKAPIFAFRLDGKAYAVTHDGIEGGRTARVGDAVLFFYRRPGSAMFASTAAFAAGSYASQSGAWIETESGCRFDPDPRTFEGKSCPSRINGFDTFWYTWSLNNPTVTLLK